MMNEPIIVIPKMWETVIYTDEERPGYIILEQLNDTDMADCILIHKHLLKPFIETLKKFLEE